MNHWRFVRFALVAISGILLGVPALDVAASHAAMPPLDGYLTGCTGQYYNNTTANGTPVLTRSDGAINFVWPIGTSPGPGVNANYFSARWTCSVNAPSSANYTFTMTADDGMNLLVDGNLIIWAWYDQGPTSYYASPYLNAGTHTVTVEYYNSVNGGTAQVSSALTSGGSVPASSGGNWYGEYFNNQTLSGSPTITRYDSSINFNWGGGSPDPAIPVDHFSVRWTQTTYLSAGTWQFTAASDDGVRLWVDSSLVIDKWFDQSYAGYTVNIPLGAGNHTLRLEYYDNIASAAVALAYGQVGGGVAPPPAPSSGNWYGEYFNNQTLSGSPTITRYDSSINFNWGGGSPDPAIPVDHFSVRWTQTTYLSAGTWQFTAASDDGVRLWVDNSLVIDKWFDHSYTGYTVNIPLGAGNHTLRLEYYENIAAAAVALAYGQVGGGIAPPPPPTPVPPPYYPSSTGCGVWHGQYFNNLTLSGYPALVRDDSALNYNWGEGSPGPGVGVDFSAKWDSVQSVPYTGNTTITATSDDGVRIWVDGALVLEGWYDHGPTTFTASPYLTAGAHNFHVEFYDRTLGAMIVVQIAGSTCTATSPSTGNEIIVDDQGVGWQAGGFSPWYAAAGINGHAFWTVNHSNVAYGYNWARWYPTLTAPGNYEVFAYIPGGYGTTLYARYWVRHGGAYNLVVRPQGFNPNNWMSLGTYYFNAAGGGSEYVSLADVTYECPSCTRVAFDAIKFSPR